MRPLDVHVIAHTHWDREWYLTFEQYRVRLVDLVDRVLERMAADPQFMYFHLDGQTVVLEDYLAIRPDRAQELRARIAEGRLLVGPWYVMPDMFLVSGEALVRNLSLGLRTAAAFGGAMRVGYMPDPFGHIAQMPQILAGFGLEGAILWRGFGGRAAEYWWEALDGSRVLLLHLPPEGYCNGLRLPMLPSDRRHREAAAILAREGERSVCGRVLLMMGVDHVEPHPGLQQVVSVLAEAGGNGSTIRARLSTLPAYVTDVASAIGNAGDLDAIRGELRGGEDYAHLLPGVLSARTYLKQANARVQRELECYAEPLSVFALLSGAGDDRGLLQYAWRTLLQNHPHDSICGCSIDAVHDENLTRFAKALQVAEEVTARAARGLAAGLPSARPGTLCALAINPDLAVWSGVLEAVIDVPLDLADADRDRDAHSFDEPLIGFGSKARLSGICDHRGHPVPFQVTSAADATSYRLSRYAPPVPVRVRRLTVALQMESIPPLGYSTLGLEISEGAASARGAQPPVTGVWLDGTALENELVRVEVREDGSVDVLDKRTAQPYPAVFALEDQGDVGDEYNFSPPIRQQVVTSREAVEVRVRPLLGGPLVAALAIDLSLPVPAGAAPDRASRLEQRLELRVSLEIRLRAGSSVVECRAHIDNRARDHRLRVLWPTGARTVDHHRADTAFAVVERPATKERPPGPLREEPVAAAPMQSFVDTGDDKAGATVIADGLMEYEIVPGDASSRIALTLIRAVGDLSRDDLSTRQGHAGPGLATPGAQCQGPHEFRFAFAPRGAPPPAGELCRLARSVLAPPRLFVSAGGDGSLPPSRTWLDVSSEPEGAVVLSACKVADGRPTVILRVFNAGPEPATVRVSAPELAEIYAVDLAEEREAVNGSSQPGLQIVLGPHQIRTFECVPSRAGAAN